MDQQGKRSRSFALSEHPFCCFCGGHTAPQEEDHQPARCFFDKKDWPQGFSFPACRSCNRWSSAAEGLLAFLSRLSPGTQSKPINAEFAKYLRAVREYQPRPFKTLSPTLGEARAARRKFGIALRPGQSSLDLPLISVKHPLVRDAFDKVGTKLGLAFYYRHTGKVIPAAGGLSAAWYTNLQFGKIPKELMPFFQGTAPEERWRDQFFYHWGLHGRQAMFLVFFRDVLATLIHVSESAEDITAVQRARLMTPLRWCN